MHQTHSPLPDESAMLHRTWNSDSIKGPLPLLAPDPRHKPETGSLRDQGVIGDTTMVPRKLNQLIAVDQAKSIIFRRHGC
jgi:hypothetical protein